MPRYYKVVAENRKAYFDFHILEKFEAGIVLRGSEVKSIRDGKANLKESFVRPENGELWLFGAHITPYKFAGSEAQDPLRQRKLLLSKPEIKRISAKYFEKRLAIVPLKIYFSGNYAKVELGIGKGKKLFDKKDSIKKKDLDREMGRDLVDRNN
ncbi:MAG: SsrA-binding protein SmpB [Candidatus Margulisiibacteriota bacterium]